MPTPQEEIEEIKRLREIEEIKSLRNQASSPAAASRRKLSELESGISGAADTLTFGFSDEIGAGGRALVNAPFKKEGLGNLYDQYLNEQRQYKAQAEEDNPGYYLGGNVAGAVLPALATGGASAAVRAPTLVGRAYKALIRPYKALMPLASRSISSNLARGAAAGALTAAGQSNARPTDSLAKAEEFGSDVLQGGALGGGTTALFGGLGAVGKFVGDKVRPSQIGSVMLGIPTEAAELYVKNPTAVNAAQPRHQITQKLMQSIGQLQDEVIDGSQASRDILTREGKKISGDQLAKIADNHADAIIRRSEGALDDEMLATVKYLKDTANKFRSPKADPDLARALVDSANGALSEEGAEKLLRQEAQRKFSTNRVKDLVQSTRRKVDYDAGAGKFLPVDERVKKQFATDVDQLLKSTSPQYIEQMRGVAKDTDLLKEVSSLAGTPQSMDNLLSRVQRERAYFPAQKIGELDKRMGTKYLQDLKLSQAKEAFTRGAAGPGGSQKVNLYKEIGREIGEKSNIPFGGSMGAVAGATVDKYGPAMGKQILDAAHRSQKILQESGADQMLGKYGPILKAAAARGPAALVTTNQALLKDPEYRKIISPRAEEGP